MATRSYGDRTDRFVVRSAAMGAQSGFTLVELLVVIAIIGILASLLLPSLAAAKNRGKAAVCMGNQRQCAIVIHQYADDAGSYIPTLRRADNAGWSPWWGWLGFMKYGGYAETIEMAMCPSVTYVSTVDYTTNYRHYGLNYKAYLGGISRFSMAGWSRTEDGFVNMGLLSRRIDRPADFILGADTNNQSLAATGVYVMITYFEPGSYAIWLIHQRMANTFFLDGHVARLGRGELATGLTSTMKFSYY